MRKSLYLQTFLYLLFSLLLVVTLLSSIFFFSIRRSVAVWNVNRGQRLESLLLPILTKTYREEGRLEELSIHRALSPFLTANVFAYVFNPEQEPVYIYHNGGRVPHYNEKGVEESLGRLSSRERPLTAIIGNSDVVGYLAADTLGFTNDVANRNFLQTVFSFLGWGIGMALFVALVAAFLFSRILAGQAKPVAEGLKQLSRGERGVKFPPLQAEELHAIAESAEELQRRLHEEEELRRQWAEDVAHDLRTPVSALKLQLEGLADGVFSPSRERFSSLYREAGRIEALVRDLRELNRVESPELILHSERIALREFLEGFRSLFPSFDRKEENLDIQCHVDSCWGDRHYLGRALENGLRNALIHGEDEGQIRLEVKKVRKVRKEEDSILFVLSNPGYISPEQAGKAFHRLYRASRSRSDPGSGLGLTIIRAIMRAHGGSAEILQKGERVHLLLYFPGSCETASPVKR